MSSQQNKHEFSHYENRGGSHGFWGGVTVPVRPGPVHRQQVLTLLPVEAGVISGSVPVPRDASCSVLTSLLEPSLVVSPCRTQVSDLALLVARMQRNADKVEKDILQSEQLLAAVSHVLPVAYLIPRINEGDGRWVILTPAGLGAGGEEAAVDAPEGGGRQAGAGRGPAEEPLHGRGQGQEAAAPAGWRHREGVS